MQMLKNRKTYYKSGFTLAELICALAVLSVCIAMAIVNIKPAQKAAIKYLYSNAFHTTQKAFYNAMIKQYNPFIDIVDKTTGRKLSVTHGEGEDTGTQRLCDGLTFFINTSSTSCSSKNLASEIGTDISITSDMTDAEKGALVTNRQEKIQFTTANGMQYFISGMMDKTLNGNNIKFYIVYVDVNGDKEPNSLIYTKRINSRGVEVVNEPDIFAFALLDSGLVCPLGIPEYDTNIMTARISYFDNEGRSYQTRRSLPYYQAKASAWGFYGSGDDENKYYSDVPFTMNDAIRSVLNSNSLIVKDFPDFKTLEPAPMAVASEAPTYCSAQTVEACDVFIDEYLP